MVAERVDQADCLEPAGHDGHRVEGVGAEEQRHGDGRVNPGPQAILNGWSDQCWTPARIAEIVRRRFGVEYTVAGLTRPGGLAAIA
ncbi:winged helix-turn-helix domain-containing protein [Streptomyces mirabilis]|uniref:winged helix-turn-helix domain-containing protein n=1 Tax=Streptomyces mirabilis TaxID=68239 RepID=UPI00331DEE32